MIYTTYNSGQTYNLGQNFASRLQGGEVVCFYGPLGAGKSTFIKGVINFFLPKKRVISPTFIIVRHYYPAHSQIKNIIHADLYRLDNIKDIYSVGLNDFINQPDCIVLIEWAEKLKTLLPQKRIDVIIKIKSENKREISIQ